MAHVRIPFCTAFELNYNVISMEVTEDFNRPK